MFKNKTFRDLFFISLNSIVEQESMQLIMEENNLKITRTQRRKLNGHGSFLIFFTGLSGSGKSTIANALENLLFELKIKTYVLMVITLDEE